MKGTALDSVQMFGPFKRCQSSEAKGCDLVSDF